MDRTSKIIICLGVALIIIVWSMVFINHTNTNKIKKQITTLEAQVVSLEKSVVTLQEFTISHDQMIYNNMLTLYRAIDAPIEDIRLIEAMILSRENLWKVIK